MSVLAMRSSSVVANMLTEERDLMEWSKLNVEAESGVNCEHQDVLVTNLLQRH